MAEKIPVSVYVLTYNNRRTIERCLRSLGWAEELVVVDSFSTDGTFEICRRYTSRAYQRAFEGHRDQYQYAADQTTREWILFVDADEEIPPELAREIRDVLKNGAAGVDAFYVYRQTFYLGRWIRFGGWHPDGEIRLYRRDRGRWEGGLHAKIAVKGQVQFLKNKYLHYTYGNLSDQIQTIDKYSRIAAEDMIREGRRFSLFQMLFHPPFRFLKEYLLKRGFLDGMPGLIIVVSTMFYVFVKYAKFWEMVKTEGSGSPETDQAGSDPSGEREMGLKNQDREKRDERS